VLENKLTPLSFSVHVKLSYRIVSYHCLFVDIILFGIWRLRDCFR